MIEIAEMDYNASLPVWVVLTDGVIYQVCRDEETALRVADELQRGAK